MLNNEDLTKKGRGANTLVSGSIDQIGLRLKEVFNINGPSDPPDDDVSVKYTSYSCREKI